MNNKTKFKKIIGLLVLSFVLFLGVFYFSPVLAQSTDTLGIAAVDKSISLGGDDIRVIIAKIIRAVLGLLGLVAVVIVIYGGFTFMTAGGDEEKVARGKKILINGLIGLAIILCSFIIVQFVLGKLGEATGLGGDGKDPRCKDPIFLSITENYNWCFPDDLLPLSCEEKHFVVTSITPVTNNTNMNNVVGRVVFSKRISNDLSLNSDQSENNVVMVKYRENSSGSWTTSTDFKFEQKDNSNYNNSLIEITYNGTNLCNDGETKCLPAGNYEIIVNPKIKDIKGKSLEIETEDCGNYPNIGEFVVNIGSLVNNNISQPDFFAKLRGVKSYIQSSDRTSFDNIGLSVWIKPDLPYLESDSGDMYTIMQIDESDSTGRYNLYLADLEDVESGGTDNIYLVWEYGVDGKSNYVNLGNRTELNEKWTNIVVSHDKSSGYNIFINGVSRESGSVAEADKIGVNNKIINIGGADLLIEDFSTEPVARFFPGYLHNIYIYNATLSNELVQNFYNNGNGLYSYNWADADIHLGLFDGSGTSINNNGVRNEIKFNATNIDWVANEDNDAEQSPSGSESVLDTTAPVVSVIKLVGGGNLNESKLIAGKTYNFYIDSVDKVGTLDGGIGYVHFNFNKLDSNTSGYNFFGGPSISRGSATTDQNPYKFSNDLRIPRGANTTDSYVVALDVYDHDNNHTVVTSSFQIIPEHCGNGVQDGDELDIDVGGSCGSIDFCVKDSDCAPTYKCIDSAPAPIPPATVDYTTRSCQPFPYIEEVDPMDGGAGNWISILGKNFGSYLDNSATGTIEFGIRDEQKNIVSWKPASVVSCGEQNTKSWQDQWIIVEVPNDEILPIDSLSAIRLTTARKISIAGEFQNLQDTTIDDWGPNPGPKDRAGWFLKNDIIRPGLCKVINENPLYLNSNIGLVKDTVRAIGKGFGSSRGSIYFNNNVQGNIRSWSDAVVRSIVPNLDDGTIPVFIQIGDKKSNKVPFSVIIKDQEINPVITLIDPKETTPGSYITIVGRNFGNIKGNVYLSSEKGGTRCGETGSDCVDLSLDMPLFCGNTWSDNQIVVKVPEEMDFVADDLVKYLTVKNTSNLYSSGENNFQVNDGEPMPSICSIEPTAGPAPRPEGEEIVLSGINFSNNPTVYFSTENSEFKDQSSVNGWLYTPFFDEFLIGLKNINEGQSINTPIPYDLDYGFSMKAGLSPIKIKDSDGRFSNSIYYNVTDCRTVSTTMPGYQCCSDGSEAGKWKPVIYGCEGETKNAGYVWRFTTGFLPNQPYVEVSCNDTDFPSPVPSVDWNSGQSACINSIIAVRFGPDNMTMSAESINTDTVKVYKCNEDTDTDEVTGIDYDDCDEVDLDQGCTGLDCLVLQNNILKIYIPPENYTASTWYHVELMSDIQSAQPFTELGKEIIKKENLRVDRPMKDSVSDDGTVAFNFDFRTGSRQCTLAGAFMNPNKHTTNILGIVQDPRHPFVYEFNKIFDINRVRPLYYYLTGKGDQECSVIDADGFGWVWDTTDSSKATAERSKGLSSTGRRMYEDSRGIATGWMNTFPDVLIRATTNTVSINEEAQKKLEGQQTLIEEQAKIDSLGIDLMKLAGVEIGTNVSSTGDINSFDFGVIEGDQTNLDSPFTLEIDYLINQFNVGGGALNLLTKGYDYSLYYPGNGAIKGLCFKSNGSSCSGIVPSIGTRYHYILTWDGSEMKWYDQNGLIQSVSDNSPLIAISTSTDPFKIGHYTQSANYNLYKLRIIDEVVDEATRIKIFNTYIPENIENLTTASTIIATSSLVIDLSNPKVVEYWPNCIEACINTQIGVRFNMSMVTSSYSRNGGNIKLYKCSDENCDDSDIAPVAITLKPEDYDENQIKFYPDLNLSANSWYKVKLTDGIKAIGGIKRSDLGFTILEGDSLEEFSWIFKTKNDSTPCLAESVDILPDPSYAFYVGEKNKIQAQPNGAPDSCSPYGQALNPWFFTWDWVSNNSLVFKISNFSTSNSLNPYCGKNCLYKGSDIARSDKPVYVCGNGTVDPGEDCDISGVNEDGIEEVANVSCNYICLRPGNNDFVLATTTIDAGKCGDGHVNYTVGEECDPGISEQKPYCANNCLWQGTSNVFSAVQGVGYCGSGEVKNGEDCDVALDTTDNTGKIGCSANCLHEGTPLSQAWCDQVGHENLSVCQDTKAVSVCGNRFIEKGEECEIGKNGATDKTCDINCLLFNVCETSLSQCVEGSEGCKTDCTWAGSSVLYTTSAICGDSVIGIGEYGDCEVTSSTLLAQYGTSTSGGLAQSPVQITTAIGQDESVGDVPGLNKIVKGQMSTSTATTVGYFDDDGDVVRLSSDYAKTGFGDYYLVCGYNEFDEPENGKYNQCPANDNNEKGVAINSCCYKRPVRVGSYPEDGEGFTPPGVCRNTYIEATIDGYLDPQAVNINNFVLIKGFDNKNHVCATDNPAIQQEQERINNLGIDLIKLGGKDIGNSGYPLADNTSNYSFPVNNEILNLTRPFTLEIKFVYNQQFTQAATELIYKNGAYRLWYPSGITNGLCFSTGDKSVCNKERPVVGQEYDYIITWDGDNMNWYNKKGLMNSGLYNTRGKIDGTLGSIATSTDPFYVGNPTSHLRTTNANLLKLKIIDQVVNDDTRTKMFGQYSISESGSIDVTEVVNELLNKETVNGPQELTVIKAFFSKIWNGIKTFLVRLFGIETHASDSYNLVKNKAVWCTVPDALSLRTVNDFNTTTTVHNGEEKTIINHTTTTISAYLSDVLAENTTYGILMIGGNKGMRDKSGVSIKNAYNSDINDAWFFKTGSQICKITEVNLSPNSYLFDAPNTSSDFDVMAISKDEKSGHENRIVSTPAYAWEWSWGPNNHKVFDIPQTTNPYNTISVSNVEGTATAIAKAVVTQDVDTTNNQKGLYFADSAELTAMFCENPWPAKNADGTWLPYRGQYNFSFSYCADDGVSGDRADDLPFFKFRDVTKQVVLGEKIPGKCSFGENDCFENSDCPFSSGNFYAPPHISDVKLGDNYWSGPLCLATDPIWTLLSNGCKVFQTDTGKFCGKQNNQSIIYPPDYDGIYKSCSSDSDCDINIGESCLDLSENFKISNLNSCVGSTVSSSIQNATPVTADTIQRIIAFADNTDDVFGFQIFSTDYGDDVLSWYKNKFPDASPQSTEIAGYQAIQDENNYYISAKNFVKEGNDYRIYNNIYSFSVNEGASDDSKNVLSQILDSLQFNLNMSNYGYCLADSVSNNRKLSMSEEEQMMLNNNGLTCANDFDCRDTNGTPLSGTNGVCSNAKTKLFRDIDRVDRIASVQSSLASYFNNNWTKFDFKGALKGGTYIPGYTVSVWPSWNDTLAKITNQSSLPQDNINTWSACSDSEAESQTCWNAGSLTYSCPAYSSVFEYEFVSNTASGKPSFMLHAPLEFLPINSHFVTDKGINTSTFTTDPYCQSDVLSLKAGTCGDGVIQPGSGEECEPIGSSKVSQSGYIPAQIGKCDYSSVEKECGVNNDCPKVLIGGYVVAENPETTVCNYNGSLLYGDVNGNEIEVFPCDLYNRNEDCLKKDTYTESDSKEIKTLYPVNNFVVNDDWQLSPMDGFECSSLQSNGAYDELNFGTCVGSRLAASTEPENCPAGSTANYTCSPTCTWTPGTCLSKIKCGNSMVEVGEACDDGALNGKYGQCNSSCGGLSEQYCGNGRQDFSGSNSLEFCENISEKAYSVYSGSVKYCYHNPSIVGCKIDRDCPEYDSGIDGLTVGTMIPDRCISDTKTIVLSNADGSLVNRLKNCNSESPLCKYFSTAIDYSVKNYIGYCENNKQFLCNNALDCVVPNNFESHILTSADISSGAWLDKFTTDTIPVGTCLIDKGKVGSSYNFNKENSCSWDCQKYGEYCGDGMQNGDEECDGGSSCDSNCRNIINPPPPIICGDKKVEGTEKCDPGKFCENLTKEECTTDTDCIGIGDGKCQTRNNARGSDGEGQYTCSADCKTRTKYVSACGNGILDDKEVCDGGLKNGKVCVPEYGKSCTYCSNDCQKVFTKDSPYYCGNGKIDQIKPGEFEVCDRLSDGKVIENDKANNNGPVGTPKSCPDKGKYTCTDCTKTPGNECYRCEDGYSVPQLSLINVTGQKDGNDEYKIRFWRIDTEGSSGINQTKEISSTTISYNSIFTLDLDGGVYLNDECKDEYKFFFSDANDSTTDDITKGDVFEFPKPGTNDPIYNDFIFSPAVPVGVFRVVVAWTNNGYDFIPDVKIYNNDFSNITPNQETVIGILDDLENLELCDSNNYKEECYSILRSGILYFHKIVDHGNLKVQSITIDTRSNSSVNSNYKVFIGNFNNDEKIGSLKDTDIKVYVYGHHDGQADYSIYNPINTFEINKSAGNIDSSYPYWHVFDLMNSQSGVYSLASLGVDKENGEIKSSFAEIVDSSIYTGFYKSSKLALNIRTPAYYDEGTGIINESSVLDLFDVYALYNTNVTQKILDMNEVRNYGYYDMGDFVPGKSLLIEPNKYWKIEEYNNCNNYGESDCIVNLDKNLNDDNPIPLQLVEQKLEQIESLENDTTTLQQVFSNLSESYRHQKGYALVGKRQKIYMDLSSLSDGLPYKIFMELKDVDEMSADKLGYNSNIWNENADSFNYTTSNSICRKDLNGYFTYAYNLFLTGLRNDCEDKLKSGEVSQCSYPVGLSCSNLNIVPRYDGTIKILDEDLYFKNFSLSYLQEFYMDNGIILYSTKTKNFLSNSENGGVKLNGAISNNLKYNKIELFDLVKNGDTITLTPINKFIYEP